MSTLPGGAPAKGASRPSAPSRGAAEPGVPQADAAVNARWVPLLDHAPVDTSMLFFDLVLVFAVTCLSGVILAEPGPRGLLHAGILLVLTYWLWAGATVHASMADVSGDRGRLWVLAISLAALALAIAIPGAFGDRGLLLAITYWLGRSLIAERSRRRSVYLGVYGLSAFVSGPLLVLGALLPPAPWRELVWGLASVIELVGVAVLRGGMTSVSYDAEHVVERFGALVLIALGESLVAIGEPLVEVEELGWAQAGVMSASFVLISALWWSYFHHGDRLVRERLESVDTPVDVVRSILAYGHLVLVAGIILVAVGLHTAMEEPTVSLGPGPSMLLGVGTAAFLAEFVDIRWHAFRRLYRSKATGALVALAVGVAGTRLPALVTVVLLALAVAAIDVWEVRSPRGAGVPADEELARS